jgi:transcriptional regulator with PAS, ATPase and Fis domain
MSTARAAVVESISKRGLRGLPSRLRKPSPSARLTKIRNLAEVLMAEADSLEREHAQVEAATTARNLDVKSGIDFFNEVRRFEIQLIRLALSYSNGNQAKAAKLLGLGATTLNYKMKTYQLA